MKKQNKKVALLDISESDDSEMPLEELQKMLASVNQGNKAESKPTEVMGKLSDDEE